MKDFAFTSPTTGRLLVGNKQVRKCKATSSVSPAAASSDVRRHLLNQLLARLLSSCQPILAGEHSAPPRDRRTSFGAAADSAPDRTQSLLSHRASSSTLGKISHLKSKLRQHPPAAMKESTLAPSDLSLFHIRADAPTCGKESCWIPSDLANTQLNAES